MPIVNRILLLTLVSAAGIALLAPLAARSAATPTPQVEAADRLLPIPGVSDAGLDRGTLSARQPAPVPAVTGAERVDASPLPTPASAPMEATLHAVATPAPTPAPAAMPAPPRAPPPAPPGGDSVWDALAQCESGGNWSINTGNGYYGGLQFSYGTWHDYGGGEFAEYPHQASRAEQIAVAERLRDARGYAPWPACRLKLGLP